MLPNQFYYESTVICLCSTEDFTLCVVFALPFSSERQFDKIWEWMPDAINACSIIPFGALDGQQPGVDVGCEPTVKVCSGGVSHKTSHDFSLARGSWYACKLTFVPLGWWFSLVDFKNIVVVVNLRYLCKNWISIYLSSHGPNNFYLLDTKCFLLYYLSTGI